VQAVAGFYALGWHTVKALDKARLRAELAEPDWASIRYLAMDEFALHKGHRYATVVVEPTRRQVLWVGEGRSRESARAFFEQLPEGVCDRIEAVAIDMTTAYELEIRAHCPRAEVVYDLFHVVAKYGREVIDRVRVDEANRLREDRRTRRVVKSSRWLLLRNRSALDDEQAVRLEELLAANQALLTVYLLRDELKRLWFYRHQGWAQRAWRQWYQQACDGRIAPLRRFAERLKPYLHGIIARCRHRLNTSVVEGINNTIKVIKRRAYGYRDQEYFFLKIRAAFPGVPR
jgi:transposase